MNWLFKSSGKVKCPACGHDGVPKMQRDEWSAAEMIPVIDLVLEAKRRATAAALCQKCGAVLKDALLNRASDAVLDRLQRYRGERLKP